MEFLKALFQNGEALTYEQLETAIKAAKLNVVNVADGSFVSRDKFNDKVNTLTQQVTDLQGQITQRDTDMKDLNTKLAAAQADASKLPEVQEALTGMQTQYETTKQDYEAKLSHQSYEFAVREKANVMKFSSNAAKKAFIEEAIGKEFKLDGDTLLGYEDFVTKYKESDPGAFVVDKPADPTPDPATPPAPTVVLPSNPQNPAAKKGLMEMMKAKNDNPNLVVDFGN
ncbi:MAG: phage scaffolding protein [Lachnospiraceae bacterium]|nr:phage scaffolding protein [Lachnospiraceae bacterium]